MGWKHPDWRISTADRNRSDMTTVARSVPVNVHGIIIFVPIFLAKFGSEQVILGRPWETYARQGERILDNGTCDIAIPAIDGSEQVMIVVTLQGDKRDGFASSSGNVYLYVR